MILLASAPCSVGGPRAVRRADADGAPSAPGRLGRRMEAKQLMFLVQILAEHNPGDIPKIIEPIFNI